MASTGISAEVSTLQRPPESRLVAALVLTALTLGFFLMGPFWLATAESIAAHAMPPGSAALFTGGILLVAVGAWFQWQLVRGGKGVAADRRRRTIALLVFLVLMTVANAIIIAEMAAVRMPWTPWDTRWIVVAGAAFAVLLPVLRHSDVRPVAVQVSAALAGRVVIQAAVGGWELAARVSMPGDLLLFIAAFSACRVVPVVVQWYHRRQVPATALLVTESANAASLLLLGVAWLAAVTP
jgi:hypothetical protein